MSAAENQNEQDLEQLDYDKAVDEALEGESRAADLRRMTETLRLRRQGLAEELKAITDERERNRVKKEIAKLDEQIAVLNQEANISQFVEDAVRVGIEMRKYQD